MKNIFLVFIFCISIAHAQVSPDNRQIVMVITDSWETPHAHMYRFGRQDDNVWKQSPGDPIPAVVGKNGMAWGRGLHPEADALPKSPHKVEGDGKAPAGIFTFGQAFGYDRPHSGVRLPTLELSPSLECVDDSTSKYYNRIMDKKSVESPDWKTSEVMRRKDELYRVGIVIEHNMPPKKEKGSCIFLHVWNGPDSSTAGCTATHDYHVRTLQNWLDTDKKPLFIQLPWNDYLRLRDKWKLPDIPKPL